MRSLHTPLAYAIGSVEQLFRARSMPAFMQDCSTRLLPPNWRGETSLRDMRIELRIAGTILRLIRCTWVGVGG